MGPQFVGTQSTMQLPFSHEAFLDNFGAYNSAFWPVALALWIVSTLVTAGFLIGIADMPPLASVLPLLWAVVGSSAAFSLNIYADLGLLAAAFLLACKLVVPRTH